jgi:transglutaminase/protease-like cytokinesis protein 3
MTRALWVVPSALVLVIWLCPAPSSSIVGRDEVKEKDDLPTSLREYAVRAQGRHAYGLYVKGKKVGWEIEDFRVVKEDGKEVLVATSESHFQTTSEGEKSVSTEHAVTVYELEGEGTILRADVKAVSDKTVTTRKAVRKGKGLEVTSVQGKRKTVREIPMPKDTLELDRKFEAWLRSGPKKGQKFTKYSLSWDEDEVDTEETYIYKERKTIDWGGLALTVHLVDAKSKEAVEETQLMPDGRPLTSTLGPITLRLEKEAVAKKLDGGDIDLMSVTSILVDTDMGRARDVVKLTLDVTGLGDFDLPVSHRQTLKRTKETAVLELLKDFKVEKEEPLSKEDRSKYVKATPSLQSDHTAIRTQAEKIVGKEKDPQKMAALLTRWVFKTVRKSYKDNADTALAVLDNKAGDCTEHSLLFVALARAVGLPAREVGGVAYVQADQPLFGWHAWAEIHDGRQWVSVDPTWDEVFVDATHIKLSEGSQNLAWVNLVGRLKIKVVKFEKKGK